MPFGPDEFVSVDAMRVSENVNSGASKTEFRVYREEVLTGLGRTGHTSAAVSSCASTRGLPLAFLASSASLPLRAVADERCRFLLDGSCNPFSLSEEVMVIVEPGLLEGTSGLWPQNNQLSAYAHKELEVSRPVWQRRVSGQDRISDREDESRLNVKIKHTRPRPKILGDDRCRVR